MRGLLALIDFMLVHANDWFMLQVDVPVPLPGSSTSGSATWGGGSMNTAGNLGGVAQASLVPLLVQQFGWIPALATGSLLGLVSALLWLFIRVDQ